MNPVTDLLAGWLISITPLEIILNLTDLAPRHLRKVAIDDLSNRLGTFCREDLIVKFALQRTKMLVAHGFTGLFQHIQ